MHDTRHRLNLTDNATKQHTDARVLSLPQDDAVVNMRSLAIQLKEMEEDRDRIEDRLVRFQKCLGEAEEGSFSPAPVPSFPSQFFVTVLPFSCVLKIVEVFEFF